MANESRVELTVSPCSYGNTDRTETARFTAFYTSAVAILRCLGK